MSKRILAIDIGTSNGRAVIAQYDGGKITIDEVHRFRNQPVKVNGTVYWDILNLFREVKASMVAAHKHGGFESLGITTWGSDFGLLDKYDDLIQNPAHFADARTKGMTRRVFDYLPKQKVYTKTGVQVTNSNTIYQLMSLRDNKYGVLKRSRTLLMIPDLLNFMLTGKKVTERTIASTTQMLNINSQRWDFDLMLKLDLPHQILTDIVNPGDTLGKISGDICTELNIPTADVVAVCSYDTLSSLLAVPTTEKDFIFIDSGGWSSIGTEMDGPIINNQAENYNLSNHTGYDYSTYLNKNVWSLGIIKKLRKQWEKQGEYYTFEDLNLLAEAEEPFRCFIDPDLDIFITSQDCVGEIINYCTHKHGFVPRTNSEIIRCVYDSIAMKYKHVYNHMKECTHKEYKNCYIVGLGAMDNLLCTLVADALNLNVIAGPVDSATIGNSLAQFIAARSVSDVEEARRIVINSFETKTYSPASPKNFDEAYKLFAKTIKY